MVAVSVDVTGTVMLLPPRMDMVSPLANACDPESPARVNDPAASSVPHVIAPVESVTSSVQLG